MNFCTNREYKYNYNNIKLNSALLIIIYKYYWIFPVEGEGGQKKESTTKIIEHWRKKEKGIEVHRNKKSCEYRNEALQFGN